MDGLKQRGVEQDFPLLSISVMPSFSGLSNEALLVAAERSIYIVGGGRINVAGLTTGNIDYVCDAIAESLDTKG